MRDLHERMLSAVLDGAGLDGLAQLAAREIGAPVVILLPASRLEAGLPPESLGRLRAWTEAALAGDNGSTPPEVAIWQPVVAGGEEIGRVIALTGEERMGALIDREQVLRSVGLAVLTELAVLEARNRTAEELRGGFIADLRAGGVSRAEVERRARSLGTDLSAGLIAIAARADGGKPRYMTAIIDTAAERAIVGALDQDVYAILPTPDPERHPEAVERARDVLDRLRVHGPAAASSRYPDPADANRALEEAELLRGVVARDPRFAERLDGGAVPSGVQRLLLRALGTDPSEVMRFYADTVEALVRHDRQYRTDLLPTLEAYLRNDCSTKATAAALHAHRHTISHRLARIKELSGLDPASGADRERLGLGAKAFRLLEPTLPR
jgi:sugar diacid utilization regulator